MSVVIRLSSETKLTFKINVNPNDFHFYSLSSAISKVRRIILKYVKTNKGKVFMLSVFIHQPEDIKATLSAQSKQSFV